MRERLPLVAGLALLCGAVAAVLVFAFPQSEEPDVETTADTTGLIEGVQTRLAPSSPTPSPTPTAGPVTRRYSAPSSGGGGGTSSGGTSRRRAPQPDTSAFDQLPGGPFDSARDAVENPPDQPSQPEKPAK